MQTLRGWLPQRVVGFLVVWGLMLVSCFGQEGDVLAQVGDERGSFVPPVIEQTDFQCGDVEPACVPVASGDLPCDATGVSACDFCTRETLLGDPYGLRAGLAESGIAIQEFDMTQVYQGVVSGGRQQTWDYGGHSDLVLMFDAEKMGGPKGLFLKIRSEGNFGEAITDEANVLLPPSIQTELPRPDERNYAITNFLITQALSESFLVFAGKMDSLDGDLNAFAHGRGKSQFMNSAFVINPVGLRTVPYSTLAAGFSIVDGLEPLLTVAAWNPRETTTTTGLDELYEDGVTLSVEARLPTQFFDRPGHQLFAATWSSRDYTSIEQDPRLLLPGGLVALGGPAREDGSWSAYWNMDQYLYVDPKDETRGWGFFARYGAADPDTSPLAHFASAGLGGKGLLPTRPDDTWGAGYYYSWTSDSFLTNLLRIDDGQGVELYYRAMLTPYFDLTPDLQILDGGRPVGPQADEWAMVLGMRANLRF